jgi:replicative DNA helicase
MSITAQYEAISAIITTGSLRVLNSAPDNYFTDEQPARLVRWLRTHLRTYGTFPTLQIVAQQTGITLPTTTQPVQYYLDNIKMRLSYEAVSQTTERLVANLQTQNMTEVANIIRDLAQNATRYETSTNVYKDLPSIIDDFTQKINSNVFGNTHQVITSGFPEIDERCGGGWYRGDLITFAGRPGRGKSLFMIKMAYSAWLAGNSVMFVSMEMPSEQVFRRVMNLHTGVNPEHLRTSQISTETRFRLIEAANQMRGSVTPFDVVEGGMKKTTFDVLNLVRERRPQILYVDSAYLLQSDRKRFGSSGRRETISDTIEELKAVALEMDIPVVISTQFNRKADDKPVKKSNERANPVSHLSVSMLGETDVIGQASSVIIGLENPAPPHHRTRKYLTILKGREGEYGAWECNYIFYPPNFSIIRSIEDLSGEDNVSTEVALDFMA